MTGEERRRVYMDCEGSREKLEFEGGDAEWKGGWTGKPAPHLYVAVVAYTM